MSNKLKEIPLVALVPMHEDTELGDIKDTSESAIVDGKKCAFNRTTLKDIICYTIALALSAIFLFIAIAEIYHNLIYPTYDAIPHVIDYSSSNPYAPNSFSALKALQAQGYGGPDKPIVVTVVGDSLIGQAALYRGLDKKMKERLAAQTNLNFEIYYHGQPSGTVYSLMHTDGITPSMISHIEWDHSNFLLFLTNSDVSTRSPKWYGTSKWDNYLVDYRAALLNMTNYLNHKMHSNWAFSGPTVITEGPIGAPSRLKGFSGMLKDIYSINLEHSQTVGCTYIDMRAAIKSISVPWWPVYSLYATQDGEHLNELGTKLLADNFVRFLLK